MVLLYLSLFFSHDDLRLRDVEFEKVEFHEKQVVLRNYFDVYNELYLHRRTPLGYLYLHDLNAILETGQVIIIQINKLRGVFNLYPFHFVRAIVESSAEIFHESFAPNLLPNYF